MRIIKPSALKRGDIIGICAPASAPDADDTLDKGIRYLERLGYRIVLGNNIHKKRGYLAGTDAQRASDLNDLFDDSRVKAIFTVRGGYGSHRILSLLNYMTIKRNPKILVGYSDITALQLAIFSKTALITFAGPMISSDMGKRFTGEAEEWFWQCMTSTKKLPPLSYEKNSLQQLGTKNVSSGILLGGNLSLVAALVGTPYFPPIQDIVFLLEEIDERPYRIDRLLQQIKLAGLIDRSKGIALGTFIGCTPAKGKSSLTLREVFHETFHDYSYPILSGFRHGHLKNPVTIPIGIRVRLNARRERMEFLEPALSLK
ncbi:MAG: LD-carboxypeptidase [Ignavibacteriae bacterium]|nr:LD-carboxypeptidase [Ignavibacteriota bacterium]